LEIHPELENFLLPLESGEVHQLRLNLERDGVCLNPILYWKDGDKNWIVDGAHRWGLCRDLGILYPTREMKFASLDEVKLWMVEHQKGRRNLTNFQLETLREKCRRDAEQSAREMSACESEKQGKNAHVRDNPALSINERQKAAGSDLRTVARAATVVEKGVPELVDKVIAGEIGEKQAAKIAKEAPHRQRQKLNRGQTKATEPKTENTKDELGTELPVDLIEAFAARETYDRALNLLTELTKLVNPLLGDPRENLKPAPGGEHLASHRTQVMTLIQDLRGQIKFARPYVPCHLSHKAGKCPSCGGCGWLTQDGYEHSGVK
jgi:hypothetical protein